MWLLGVDLSWGFRKPSWVCVFTHHKGKTRWTEFFSFVDLTEWERWLSSFTPCIAAFDAPLQVSVERGLRKAEKELLPYLRKRRLGILPVNREIARCRYPALFTFWESIARYFSFDLAFPQKARYALEVFPPLSVLGFFGDKGLKLYREKHFWELGKLFGESTTPFCVENLSTCLVACLSSPSGRKDRFDAFLCACTALFAFLYGEKALRKFGDSTGFIVAPSWSGETEQA
nr:DUF429 domain-containing protein [Candidatus Calescibacterium sp.]